MNMKKRILSYILSMILAVFIIATVVMAVANFTILNNKCVKKKVVSTNYYVETQNIIINACKNYVMQSGFDESIMDGVINTSDVEHDVNGLLDYIYEGREYEIRASVVKSNLDNNIKKYIEQNNYEVNEENQKSIDEFEKSIEDIYVRNIEYSADEVKQIGNGVQKIKKILPIAMVICLAISIVIGFIDYKVSKPSIGVGMLAAGIVLIVIKVSSKTSFAINNILLMNKAFSNTLIAIANNMVQILLVLGILLSIVGVIWIIVMEARRKIVRMLLLEEHSQVIR